MGPHQLSIESSCKASRAHGIDIDNSRVEEVVVDADGGLVGSPAGYFKLKISGDATEDGQHLALVANEVFFTAPALPNPAHHLTC